MFEQQTDVPQPAYIFRPADDAPERPPKRRKVQKAATIGPAEHAPASFDTLLNGLENAACIRVREELFKKHWAKTEESIQARAEKAEIISDTDQEYSPF